MPPPPTDVTVTYDVEAETVTLQLTSDLAVGETTVSMEYTGILNDQMRGFYRSMYTHPDFPNEERYAGVTQFEVNRPTVLYDVSQK